MPTPPRMPVPNQSSHSWCIDTPMPPIIMPPPQHNAAMNPALRGPACSSQRPHSAAEMPSTAMNNSKVCVTSGTVQLQVVETSMADRLSALHAASSVPLSSLLIGSQNTENP